MATISLIFSSFSIPLAAGRNQIATFAVGNFASIRIYAFVRSTPQVTLYLINLNSTIPFQPIQTPVRSTRSCSTIFRAVQLGTRFQV